MAIAAILFGCGDGSKYVPRVTSVLSGTSVFGQTVTAGASTAELTGIFFDPDMAAFWNGRPVPVTVRNSTSAEIQLDPAVDDPLAGTAQLVVKNGDQAAPPLPVTIADGLFAFSAVEPVQIPIGAQDITLLIHGNGFSPQTKTLWNGVPLETTLVSGVLLHAAVPAALLTAGGEGIHPGGRRRLPATTDLRACLPGRDGGDCRRGDENARAGDLRRHGLG